MAAIRVFRRLRDLVDVTFGTPNDGDVVTYDQATDKFKMAPGGSGGGAPTNATYITQTANGSLSAEQALGALATGILKSTTSTGVVSIAAAGTDYYAPGSTDVAVADGGTGASDAPTARTNLGLGTLATQNGTFSGTSSGTNTGDQTSVSGNAGTATALQTGRTIDGQTFDGTANITVIAPGTHAATSKTTPVDADELPLADSAASFVLKKLTWANLKATVKAYTDTLYPSGSGTSTGTNTGDQTISDATISTSDVTTNNVSSSKHGFAPKSPASATQFLNGAATPAYAQVKDSDLSVTDVTTNNVSTSAHGFAPKAPNDATKYLDGTGAYSVPAGSSSGGRIVLSPGSAMLPDGSTSNLAPGTTRRQGTQTGAKTHFLTLDFDGGGNLEGCHFVFRLPTNYSSGGTLKLHWMANATSGAVKWQAQVGAITPGDADTPLEHAFAAAATVTTNVNTTEAMRLTESSIALTTDSAVAGDLVELYVFRDSSDAADTCTVDASLVAAELDYS